eukprot:4632122-Pleurochrysis_carterae.AAC.2
MPCACARVRVRVRGARCACPDEHVPPPHLEPCKPSEHLGEAFRNGRSSAERCRQRNCAQTSNQSTVNRSQAFKEAKLVHSTNGVYCSQVLAAHAAITATAALPEGMEILGAAWIDQR